jgi:acetylornithine deacetylase
LLGPPSLHAAMIQGGEGVSTYAASCKLQIERRTIPGETETQAVAEIQSIIDRLNVNAKAHCYFVRDPFEVAREAKIVQAVDRASRKVLACEPEYIGDTPWMDAALLQAAGIETVVIGPAGGGAHAAVEWVELESVIQIAQILAEAAIDYSGID